MNLTGKVFTSRYQAASLILASGAAPIRITLGHPRFKLGYELAGKLPELAPRREHFHLQAEAFRAAYIAELEERLGILGVIEVLATAEAEAGGRGIILLCFEDVLGGAACHRRVLAEWIEAQNGLVVPEMGTDPVGALG